MSKRGVKVNEPTTTHAEFGRYLIHLPSLARNQLKIVYPKNKSPVQSLSYLVSPELAGLLSQLVDRGVVAESTIKDLRKEEQNLLRKICKACQIDKTVILPDDEQEKEDVKRFNLLRGEIGAGNDSPTILKEIKKYILKFSASGVIPRSKATELLIHIACLEK